MDPVSSGRTGERRLVVHLPRGTVTLPTATVGRRVVIEDRLNEESVSISGKEVHHLTGGFIVAGAAIWCASATKIPRPARRMNGVRRLPPLLTYAEGPVI